MKYCFLVLNNVMTVENVDVLKFYTVQFTLVNLSSFQSGLLCVSRTLTHGINN